MTKLPEMTKILLTPRYNVRSKENTSITVVTQNFVVKKTLCGCKKWLLYHEPTFPPFLKKAAAAIQPEISGIIVES
jgi:hypothetical protein